jgi:hypothetical protein
MSSWDKLPAEIIIKIVKELVSYKDIIQFQLTCKGWASLAQRRLYFCIRLTTEYQLNAFIKNIIVNPVLGLLVERLDISSAFSLSTSYLNNSHTSQYYSVNYRRPSMFNKQCSDFRYYFTTLTVYCPHIKQILEPGQFEEEIWQLLIEALQEGKWRQLHLIEPPTPYTRRLVYYASAVWEIRDRSTELEISDELCQIVAWLEKDTESSHSVAENTLAFPRLQNFALIKRNNYMHAFGFNNYIDNCVSLKKVTMYLLCHHSHQVGDTAIREVRMLGDIFSIKQQHAIKKLDVVLGFFHEDLFMYIMHKFPSLSELKLTVYNPKEHSTSPSNEFCHKFLEYISKIQFINIDYFKIRNVCELLPIKFKDGIKLYKRKALFVITYSNLYGVGDLPFLSIKSERSDSFQQFAIDAVSNISKLKKHNFNICIKLGVPKHYNGSALPHVVLIENLGNEIAALEIDCRTKTEVFTNIARGYFLDHILLNCSQLEKLDLTGVSLVHCSPILPVKKLLDSLSFRMCDIYPGIFTELSPLLPSLQSLRLYRCNFILENGQHLPQNPRLTMNMPHTSIDSLHLSFPPNYHSFCVKVKLHGEKIRCYALSSIHSPFFLKGPSAERFYYLDDGCCFVMNLECFSLKLLHVKIYWLKNTYVIDLFKK